MEEVDGDRTLKGRVGMAWCVGGREARFLIGLGAAGKALGLQLPSYSAGVGCEWRVIASDSQGEWRRVEWGSSGPWADSTDTHCPGRRLRALRRCL